MATDNTARGPVSEAEVRRALTDLDDADLLVRVCNGTTKVLSDLTMLAAVIKAMPDDVPGKADTLKFTQRFVRLTCERAIASLDRNVEKTIKLQNEGEQSIETSLLEQTLRKAGGAKAGELGN